MKTRGGGGQKVTQAALEAAAVRYLERYASSSENLRRVLMRRVAKAAREDPDAAEGGRGLVDTVVAGYVASGLLNDARYAEAKAAGLARAGASRHRIRGKLMQKGVDSDDISDAIATLDERDEGSERQAAAILIRKKRLGPYRAPEARDAARNKDLAAMARAGFGLGLARRLLAAEDVEALEDIVRGDE